jgi:hypothetical protein
MILTGKGTSMKSTWQPRKLQGDRITIREIEAEVLVYDERTHRAWCLNPSSACIWQLCDGRNTVGDIAVGAAKKLGSAVNEDLVLLTMQELQEKGLLEGDMVQSLPQDASRRRMIGKIGLAAAALLPVVAAITAPPALAQGGTAGTGGAAITREQKRRALAARNPEPGSSPTQQDAPSDPYTR